MIATSEEFFLLTFHGFGMSAGSWWSKLCNVCETSTTGILRSPETIQRIQRGQYNIFFAVVGYYSWPKQKKAEEELKRTSKRRSLFCVSKKPRININLYLYCIVTILKKYFLMVSHSIIFNKILTMWKRTITIVRYYVSSTGRCIQQKKQSNAKLPASNRVVSDAPYNGRRINKETFTRINATSRNTKNFISIAFLKYTVWKYISYISYFVYRLRIKLSWKLKNSIKIEKTWKTHEW